MSAECPVCFEELQLTIAATPPCGHTVCLKCLLSLRRQVCVLCRCDLASLIPATRPAPRLTRPLAIFQPAYDDIYVSTLLRLHEQERRRVRRIGANGAELTLISVADSSSDDDDDEGPVTAPLFLSER